MMASVEKRKKASKEQQTYLINYLQNDLCLARFSAVDGRQTNIKKWESISVTLNSIGGSRKNGEQWKKYWEDFRIRTKEKYVKIKKFNNQSGVNDGGPYELNELEQKIISIISPDAVDGDHVTPELEPGDTVPLRPSIPEPILATETQVIQICEKNSNRKSSKYDREVQEKQFMEEALRIKKKKLEVLQDLLEAKKKKMVLYEKFETEHLNLPKKEIEIRERELLLKEREAIALEGDYLEL